MLPISSISFRPFFLLGALLAALNPLIWVLVFIGKLSWPMNNVGAAFWHGHEMIFGFAGALIAGFILTASANWTNTVPYRGAPLLFLVYLWGLERISYFLPVSADVQFILMNLFFPALFIMLFLKLKNSPKQKYVFVPILLGITTMSILHSWGYLYSSDDIVSSAQNTAVAFIRLIVLLIAGRVIPFFSSKRIEGINIDVPSWINKFALIPIVLLCVLSFNSIPESISIVLLVFAIVGNIVRQCYWKPLKTLSAPILFILHVGIFFINLSLIFELASLFYSQAGFAKSSLHMLMASGLGIVGIGIMTRVSLGHTGRAIKADKLTILSYVFIFLGSLLRGLGPVLLPKYYFHFLHSASFFWSLGFFMFVIGYLPILTKARPDGKEY